MKKSLFIQHKKITNNGDGQLGSQNRIRIHFLSSIIVLLLRSSYTSSAAAFPRHHLAVARHSCCCILLSQTIHQRHSRKPTEVLAEGRSGLFVCTAVKELQSGDLWRTRGGFFFFLSTRKITPSVLAVEYMKATKTKPKKERDTYTNVAINFCCLRVVFMRREGISTGSDYLRRLTWEAMVNTILPLQLRLL